NLILVLNAKQLNISTNDAIRICLFSAGFWWALFTIIPIIFLKNRKPSKVIHKKGNYFIIGFKELFNSIKDARQYPKTIIFLIAYLLYNDGVQTVIALAAVFGQEELKLNISTLTIAILMVQFIAFFGTLLFNKIAKILGTKNSIILSLFIWTGAIIYAFGFLKDKAGFFILSIIIATVLGATQALSRSLFSLLIPINKEAEYFSLYQVSAKGTSWLGPLFFGLALQFTGSYRIAILSLIFFFIAGIIILFKLNLTSITADTVIER
ncbi:MAG: MFS transporter, partial [FCB group bacterium]